jgi:hypothetical protein
MDFPFYALHHFNRVTGAIVRFGRDGFPAGPKATIEGLLSGANASRMVGSSEFHGPEWTVVAMPDVRAELEHEGVPEPIVSIVEALAHGRRWGLSDPMYMANRVATKFGWGDGLSSFGATHELPDDALVEEFARELFQSYITSFKELGLDARSLYERVGVVLREARAQRCQAYRPRG